MTNLRFHLVAISTLVLVVIIVFAATGQFSGPGAAEQQASQRTITVWEASWGLNCVDAPSRDDRAALAPTQTELAIERNNVLERLKRMCDGKVGCEFKADGASLGLVGLRKRCRPELNLLYRCYDLDRPWQVLVRSEETARLSCAQR